MKLIAAVALVLASTGCASHIRLSAHPGVSESVVERDTAECRAPSAIWLCWPTTQRQEAACLIARGYRTPVAYKFRTSGITTFIMGVDVTAERRPLPTASEALAILTACETELLARPVPAFDGGPNLTDGFSILFTGINPGLGDLQARTYNSTIVYRHCMDPQGYRVEPRKAS